MDILHLKYFLAVAHHKSFTKASQALHISQPSISKSIKTLEDEWQVTLFHRHSRDIVLTDVGQALLPQIKLIVAQFQQLNRQMTNTRELHEGDLTIGIPPNLGATFVAPIIGLFHKLYPHINISVEEHGSDKIGQLILNGSLRVGYVALPITDMPKNVYVFNDEPLQVLLPNTHRLAKKTVIDLSELKKEPLALFSADSSLYHTIMNSFQQIDTRPHVICKSANRELITEMVRAETAISLMPKRICDQLPRQFFHVATLTPTISWRIAMVWSHDVFLSIPTRLWIEFFKEKMPEVLPQTPQPMKKEPL